MRKNALIVAPHPDDESIIGLLPLRLQEECGFRVWVVPATLGSRVERQAARKHELRAACEVLEFQLRFLKQGNPEQELDKVIKALNPAVVFIPHAKDGHATHRAVHQMGVFVMDAARRDFHVVETEYWHPLERPNLMVAASQKQLAKLCRALACHKGENARNNYVARLPAWMSDNVRRGTELIGGTGAVAKCMAFATLYRARHRADGKWRVDFRGGRTVESAEDLAALAAQWAAPCRRQAPDG